MKIILVDLETTGLDASTDLVTEVGWVAYDIRNGMLDCGSSLVIPKEYAERAAGVSRITGITKELVEAAPPPAQSHNHILWNLFEQYGTNICVAHNASFDKKWFAFDSLWVCSYEDFDWGTTPGALVKMAVDMGVGVYKAHRAIRDVLTMSDMFDRYRELYGSEALYQAMLKAMEPKFLVSWDIPRNMNDRAKALKFRWNPDIRKWCKRMTETELNEFRLQYKGVNVV